MLLRDEDRQEAVCRSAVAFTCKLADSRTSVIVCFVGTERAWQVPVAIAAAWQPGSLPVTATASSWPFPLRLTTPTPEAEPLALATQGQEAALLLPVPTPRPQVGRGDLSGWDP